MSKKIRCSLTTITGLVAVIVMFAMSTGAYAAGDTEHAASTGVTSGGFAGSVGSGPSAFSFVGPLVVPDSLLLTRVRQGSFGSFSGESPQALTVDQSTGDVYAVDTASDKLLRFDSSGAPDDFTAGPGSGTNAIPGLGFQSFASFDQVAVDGSGGPSSGNIYVTQSGSGQVKVFASTGEPLGTLNGSGTPAGGLGEDCGVAVDQENGDLYISSYSNHVWRYSPSGSTVVEADYSGGIATSINPCGLAVAQGNLYVKDWKESPSVGAGSLQEYSTSAFALGTPPSPSSTQLAANATAVATDPENGNVYIDEENKISVLSPTGTQLYSFGSGEIGSSTGVAVAAAGNAYVSDSTSHEIVAYGPEIPVLPVATTNTASEVRHAEATLNGHLDPNGTGETTDCHFEWGTTTTYDNTAPCAQGNTFATPAEVSAAITGLTPGQTYHYRLSVAHETSVGTGNDQTFTTTPLPLTHILTSSFGSTGTGDGQFSGNTAVAVDQANGDVYVSDTANHRIEKFDSAGTFISAFGWGVKDGAAEAQTCSSSCQAGISGSGAGQLATPKFLAVDNSSGPSAGDVYVGDTTNNTVTKFDPNGNYISTNDGTASGSTFGPLAGIAIDQNGDLWVYDENSEMRKFAQDGTFLTAWNAGLGVTPAGIAIDSTETLYVVRGNPGVVRLSATGEYLGNVTAFPEHPNFNGPTTGLSIDPTTGDLYVDDAGTLIRRYADPSTCVYPEETGCVVVEAFGAGGHELNTGSGIAVNAATDRVYVSDPDTVKIFDLATLPDVTTGTASVLSATSATLDGAVGSNGVVLTDCHFEYVSDAAFLATGFTDLSSGGSTPCTPDAGSIPVDLDEHQVTATITGLNPTIIYHYRLVSANAQTGTNGEAALIPGPALVETTGSPTRTTTTARLDSRLDPRGAPTSYHFEYGDQGPCDSNPCTSTPIQQAGSGEIYELVSQQLTGLKPNTTYHYRIVADNGTPDGASNGQDATITTRASDAPLTHGNFPGPPGSDRAWEQVNIPNTDGNPIVSAGPAEDGERVIYAIDGGSPGSQYGGGLLGFANLQYAERTSTGWQNKDFLPPRSQAGGNQWNIGPVGRTDLTQLYAINSDITNTGPAEYWSLSPGAAAQSLLTVPYGSQTALLVAADHASRVLAVVKGSIDPAHPLGPHDEELYDLTTGTPQMVGLLPDGSVPPCGVSENSNGQVEPVPSMHVVTPDGSHAFFGAYPDTHCTGETALYVRDLVHSTTTEIAAHALFDRFTGGAAFFSTPDSIAPDDHGGTDLYRYDLGDGSTSCITCSTAFAGLVSGGFSSIGISDDGSQVYLESARRLLQGAAKDGLYRLDVSTRDLSYVAPGGFGARTGNEHEYDVISSDGSVFVFSSENLSLDARNGQQNAGTRQFYRYDARDGSLICTSCPGDGSDPRAAVPTGLGNALTTNGDLAFSTDTPLAPFDQNTAKPGHPPDEGDDLYEWRDGLLLLVTDGLTGSAEPNFNGISASGRDVFFTQPARLTADAPDAERRLYDARIGGGFDFPQSLPPCSLDACQGNPMAPPVDPNPASSSFNGPGNQSHSGSTTTTRIKAAALKAKCKKQKKSRRKCSAPAKCKKGKRGSKCRKARHANTTRRTGR